MTKQPPTIKSIEREFDEEFFIEPEIMGGKMIFGSDKVKQFYRQKITEMLGWLKMERGEQEFEDIQDIYNSGDSADWVGGGFEIGYNKAVDELNQKLKKLKGK